jgi:hypothetical protein
VAFLRLLLKWVEDSRFSKTPSIAKMTALGIQSEVISFANFAKGRLPDFGGCLKSRSENGKTNLEDRSFEMNCEINMSTIPSALILDYEY